MVIMRSLLATNYFSKLLNSTVDENTIIKLSSGQGARAHTWLVANNFNTKGLNLAGGFTISQVIGGAQFSSHSELQQASEPSFVQISSGMNASIGVDIQSVSELFPNGIPSDPKSDPELLSIYTLKELSYAQSRPNPMQTLAGLFAAKEAVIKCSTKEVLLTNLEILPNLTGKPSIDGYSVSISHSLDYAVGIATRNFCVNNNLDIKARNQDSPQNLGIAPTVKAKGFINYIILIIVLGLSAIEAFRFLR